MASLRSIMYRYITEIQSAFQAAFGYVDYKTYEKAPSFSNFINSQNGKQIIQLHLIINLVCQWRSRTNTFSEQMYVYILQLFAVNSRLVVCLTMIL